MSFLDQARELEEQIVAWRRDIHQHPELGFEETRTARLVAEEMRNLGLEVEVGVGITGVVARLGEGKPSIGIRADMDALPIQEANDVPYASQTPGVMHACGHDAHTAILMGVAKMLHAMPDRPQGEIRFLFQPSEEKWGEDGHSGATRMIDDKALDDLDAVIALHVSSETEPGNVIIGGGYVLAAVDTFDAKIIGEGCHGASPHKGLDPLFIQAQVVNAIHGIVARRVDPVEPAVVTIGAIHGGSVHNVIPAAVEIMGTIRTTSEEIRSLIHEELDKAFQIARILGGDYELKIQRGYPALYNDPSVSDLIETVASEMIGGDGLEAGRLQMGAEDFAYMAQKAPGAMFMLGVKKDEINRPHHSPIFDIDEKPLPIGAAVLAETAVRLLREKA